MQKLCGFVEQGNKTVTIGGLESASLFMQNYPLATVTVYNAGTLTLSTIYSDNGVTPKANPFTASATGFWEFYAADGRYDVKFNGGTGSLSAYTISDFLLNDPSVLTVTVEAVAYSATPTFDASGTGMFTMTLTGNVTSSTITGMATGQRIIFSLTQDATGGRTFAWPSTFSNALQNPPVIASGSNQRTNVEFIYDGNVWRQVSATGNILVARIFEQRRYADQFSGNTTALKTAAAITDLGNNQGVVVVPANLSSGDISSTLLAGAHVIDERGTGAMNGAANGYTTNNTKGLSFLQRDTTATVTPQTFSMWNLYHDLYAGGTDVPGSKSNYISWYFSQMGRVSGQRHALATDQQNNAEGDALGVTSTINVSGGVRSGIGNEGIANFRGVINQDAEVFSATLSSINGNVLTYTSPSNEQLLGVDRFLMCTSSGVYSTGTATTATSSATVTEGGGGADFESATSSGVLDGSGNPRFGFALDYDAGNPANNASSATLDYVAPITAVAVGGTTLTMRDTWANGVTGSTNTYKIFPGSIVTAVDPDNNTITVSDGSRFSGLTGQTIKLALDNRFSGYGVFVNLRATIGESGLGTSGVNIANNSSTPATVARNGYVAQGNFKRLFEANGGTIAPQYGVLYGTGPYANTIFLGINSNVDNESLILQDIQRNAATTGTARLYYLKNGERWRFTNNSLGITPLAISSTGGYVGIGSNEVSTQALTVTAGGTDHGLFISGNATGVLFNAAISGVPRFRVTDTTIFANNGANVFGYSGNQSGKTWQMTTSSGLMTTYAGISTVSNGIPSEVATVDLTAQTAAKGTTTLYAVPAAGAGQYRLVWNAKITTAATTGAATSTLGALTIVYTDPDGVAITLTCAAMIAAGTIATTSTANTTSTVLIGMPLTLNCKASTNVTYAFAYASDTAAQMAYNLHLKLESL